MSDYSQCALLVYQIQQEDLLDRCANNTRGAAISPVAPAKVPENAGNLPEFVHLLVGVSLNKIEHILAPAAGSDCAMGPGPGDTGFFGQALVLLSTDHAGIMCAANLSFRIKLEVQYFPVES